MQNAIVRTTPKTIPTKFGKRMVVNFNMNDQEVKIWGKPDDPILSSLNVGESVQLVQKGKGYTVIKSTTEPTTKKPQPTRGYKPLEKEIKKSMVQMIDEHSNILKHCFQTVCTKFEEFGLSDDNLKALAITLYIEAKRIR